MPNWTFNSVMFEGNEKQLNTLKTMLKSDENDFDFNNIIPMPKNIFRGNLGREEEEKYGKNNWYHWSIENWGTKWNACNTEIVDDTGNLLYYRFETAWDCPRQIALALLRMKKTILKDVEISWDCIHEDGAEEETIIEKGVEYEIEETT